MPSLFDASDRAQLLRRVRGLRPDAERQWGKMSPAQMLAHCQRPLAVALGELPLERNWIGRLFGGLIKRSLVGPKPLRRNGPTAPAFVVRGERDFAAEQETLARMIERFAERGPQALAKEHPFFGPMSAEEWDWLLWKHLDHHLRQFGA
jgi:hypothetical protein